MPSLNQYDERRPVSVKPFATCGVLYGFLTNVNTATGTACGHLPAGGSTPPTERIVFGANAPRPGRASKFVTDEYNSSFYDYTKVATLKADGWRLTRPSIRRARTSPRSTCVYVTPAPGFKYAWNMPASLLGFIGGDLSRLGIKLAARTDKDLVFGANQKPPKAFKADGSTTYSTFYDESLALPEGWASAGVGGRETISVSE